MASQWNTKNMMLMYFQLQRNCLISLDELASKMGKISNTCGRNSEIEKYMMYDGGGVGY